MKMSTPTLLWWYCAVSENIHTPPTEEIGISGEVGDSVRPKNLKKCMKLNWNFLRGGRVLEKIPSVGEVWIFFGISHCLYALKWNVGKVYRLKNLNWKQADQLAIYKAD